MVKFNKKDPNRGKHLSIYIEAFKSKKPNIFNPTHPVLMKKAKLTVKSKVNCWKKRGKKGKKKK